MEKDRKTSGEAARRSGGITPTGVAPVFSRTARFRRETTERLLNLFSLWGYREIILPAFEYLEAISPGIDPALLPKLYLMQDRGSGHVLVLRPDATAQIARLTTQSFQDRELPLRFSYSTSVFRDENQQGTRDRELNQTGLELIGDPSLFSDFEVLDLCLSGASIFSLEAPVLVLSHAGIQEWIFRKMETDPETLKKVRQAYYSRNLSRVDSLLKGLPPFPWREQASRFAGGVFDLQGGLEILASLTKEVSDDSSADLLAFSRLLGLLRDSPHASSLRLDFALPPPGPYYTGMFFQLFSGESPTHLASGGRYDRLGLSFGHDLPAVGFAYHINHIEEALRSRVSSPEGDGVLAFYDQDHYPDVLRFAGYLRKGGYSVSMALTNPSDREGMPSRAKRILGDHAEIGTVVYFDRERRGWLIVKRPGSLSKAASLEDIANTLLDRDRRGGSHEKG